MPRSESYVVARGYTIDIERNRLTGLRDRAKAAQSRCKRDQDRDCLQAEIDVFSGLLAALERAASAPAPDAPVLSKRATAWLEAAAERRVS
ncbi:hypothetical protein [Pseudoroseomonas ludipueritiae]|uniref:Uncharacterized protein n=1 Tax=Pseudoroseomonas ludipueritiae TaxID=198093 RepID=A0ABR7R4Z7_9PROT|nr:hypothetical protein [Pseudoroseomonas ludipueritiae]MBC9176785.1 hypothetical protein [Pseudoroseomonas ludipueritiae]